jgi:hypothetical protein
MKLFGKWQRDEAPAGDDKPAFAADTPILPIGKNRKVLVVDDNPVVLKSFELKLKASGFDVLTATEGAAAVSLARQTKPDLIVLDINFPPRRRLLRFAMGRLQHCPMAPPFPGRRRHPRHHCQRRGIHEV